MDPSTISKLGAEAAIVALFTFVVVYLFKTLIPNMQKQFSDDLDRVVASFASSQTEVVRQLEKLNTRVERLEQATDKLSSILLMHDMTVRGKNPDTGAITTADILEAVRNGRSEFK